MYKTMTQRVAARHMSKEACVIAQLNIDGARVLFKNRDRTYAPEIKVIHTRRNFVEIMYMQDEHTGWIEGINEHGIAVVNAALMVNRDEKEKGKKEREINAEGDIMGVTSEDAHRILTMLEKPTLEEALDSLVYYDGGVRGHMALSDGSRAFSIEHTDEHEAVVKLIPKNRIHVRTNHGIEHPSAGYTKEKRPEDYESSIMRCRATEEIITGLSAEEIAPALYAKSFEGSDSPLNVVRKTEKMTTTSQVVFDLINKRMLLYLIPGEVDWLGHEKTFEGEGQCTVEIYQYSYFDDDGSFKTKEITTNPTRVAREYLKQ